MIKKYYAKTDENGKPLVTVSEHCDAVADMAKEFAHPLEMADEAYICGLMHDFGKYGSLFQDVLKGKQTYIDHAMPGAAMLRAYPQLAEVVAGHHAGLKFFGQLESLLLSVCKDAEHPMTAEGKKVSLSGKLELGQAQKLFLSDHPGFKVMDMIKAKPGRGWKSKLTYMLDTRMLYSCQVDADYTVSSGKCFDDLVLEPFSCMDKLEQYRDRICVSSKADPKFNALRDEVYQNCGIAGKCVEEFLTLTAPTGSGKTLAMLKFALERCCHDKTKKRVILVLPFLSLCDQVEAVCREIFSDVLVDHSQACGDDKDLSERWACSCVITTTVQFFRSLWSDQPGDCRKLHRIADSVVLFDEIQALPEHVCRYAMQSLLYLSGRYHTCVVLSTATQPAYQHLPEVDWHAKEIIPDIEKLFSMTDRTGIIFRNEKFTMADIAKEALGFESACVIVNVKRFAREVFEVWQHMAVKNCFLLYTNFCLEHRRRILENIRRLQAQGEPVYVAATQCLEAGVDLDFHQIFRMTAPLTSLIQSAGRQNRNGRYPHSDMYVFEPLRCARSGRMYPGDEYERQAMRVKEMLSAGIDVASLSGIQEYYKRGFMNYQETKKLSGSVNEVDYHEFAYESQLIKDSGCRVVVPYNGFISMYMDVEREMSCKKFVSKRTLAKVAGITVQSYDEKNVEKYCTELLLRNHRTGGLRHTGVWILLPGHEDCYRDDIGLFFDPHAEDDILLF